MVVIVMKDGKSGGKRIRISIVKMIIPLVISNKYLIVNAIF